MVGGPRCLLLALVLLGFPLAPGLLDALAHLLGLDGGSRPPAIPVVYLASLPATERAGRRAIGKQHIPAVMAAGAVARGVETVDGTIGQGQPIEPAVDGLERLQEQPFGFLRASRSRRRSGTVFRRHGGYS
ncbi:hypothetical protein D3C78_1104900 [compost metagenome]